MTKVQKTRAPRRDAIERRAALIVAADECFSESGYLVPLEEIAQRAGVGRGTLYRNFEDRMAIAVAVLDRRATMILATFDPNQSLEETLTIFLRDGAHVSALFLRLGADMPADAVSSGVFDQVRDAFHQALHPILEQAKKGGLLANQVGAREVGMAMMMIGSLIRRDLYGAELDAEIASGIALVMDGLRPR